MYNCGIYKVENLIDGKCYVGKAVNLSYRAFIHLKRAVENKESNRYLQNAVNKYGIENFKTHIVIYCEPFELVRYEQFCVDNFNTAYNICKECVINRLGTKHSEETKEKMSKSQKIRFANNPMSTEIKNKISTSQIGKKMSAESVEKNKEWHKGRKLSEETKRHMGEAQKARYERERNAKKSSS